MKKLGIEFKRKFIHINSIVIPLSYKYILGFNRKIAISILIVLFIVSIVVEILRMEHLNVKGWFYRYFGSMLRKHEKEELTGASLLLVSALIVIAILPANLAFCALSFLSVGDTFAAIIGIKLGKRRFIFNGKSLEGSLACFLVTFIFALFYIEPVIAFVGAVFATIAEFSKIKLDDNIKIPIISGFAMWITDLLTIPVMEILSVVKVYIMMVLKAVGL